jgi:hypothetical protein
VKRGEKKGIERTFQHPTTILSLHPFPCSPGETDAMARATAGISTSGSSSVLMSSSTHTEASAGSSDSHSSRSVSRGMP